MIYEELLIVWPKTVFRGARQFGPLSPKEYNEDVILHWQILLTCRKYFEEGAPVMYGGNKLVFCTGKGGDPGQFWRFPINIRYMRYVTDLGIYLRADKPTSQASQRVAHFMKALARHGKKLNRLVVLLGSDRYYEAACPWDIPFFDHPVSQALVQLVKSQTVNHLKIRVHDGALLYNGFGSYLCQTFRENGSIAGRSLAFTFSCTCPPHCPLYPQNDCFLCGWPLEFPDQAPVEFPSNPAGVEALVERTMELQDDLFQLGLLPPKDDDDEEADEEDAGPYTTGQPVEDTYEDNRLAFHSGL
ncbi:hypothetical protein BU26DRAFT_467158, partial [Trematosphaeria pertusa]